jgi:hypothetical protein
VHGLPTSCGSPAPGSAGLSDGKGAALRAVSSRSVGTGWISVRGRPLTLSHQAIAAALVTARSPRQCSAGTITSRLQWLTETHLEPRGTP